jgi:hypothetical protein
MVKLNSIIRVRLPLNLLQFSTLRIRLKSRPPEATTISLSDFANLIAIAGLDGHYQYKEHKCW